jgi:serine protease AprX
VFTYWPGRQALSRRITWITALAAVLTAASLTVLPRVLSPVASISASSASTGASTATGPGLFALATAHPRQPVEVIVQFVAGTSPAAQRELVAAAGGQVTRDLHIINGLGVRLDAAAARRLAADARVHAVSLNAGVHSSDLNSQLTPSSLAQNDIASTDTAPAWYSGATGRNVGVAVIDTGIAGDLVDFQTSQGNPASRVVEAAAVNPAATDPYDDYGHGTHVAGLIAGNGNNRVNSDPENGAYMGTAPKANLVDVKVSDDAGNTSLIDVIYGLQFAVDHQADYNIRVVNLSLNSTVAQSYTTDPLDAAAEAAWFHGIVVVAAAGNMGTAPDAVDYAPANDPYVLTVGAVDDTQTNRPKRDVLTDWSSRGITEDGFAKPEVVAPGAHMVSTLAPNSLFTQLCSVCIVGGGSYFKISGTSMAAAVVSGTAADVASVHPRWSPDQIKSALVNTAAKTAGGQAQEVDTFDATQAGVMGLTDNVNQGLAPSTLIDPSTGNIDYTRASWTRASWTQAFYDRASWTRASWTCVCDPTGGSVDPSRASWTRASWTRASWSRVSWTSFLDLGSTSTSSPTAAASRSPYHAIHNRDELGGGRWDLRYHPLSRPTHAVRRHH